MVGNVAGPIVSPGAALVVITLVTWAGVAVSKTGLGVKVGKAVARGPNVIVPSGGGVLEGDGVRLGARAARVASVGVTWVGMTTGPKVASGSRVGMGAGLDGVVSVGGTVGTIVDSTGVGVTSNTIGVGVAHAARMTSKLNQRSFRK